MTAEPTPGSGGPGPLGLDWFTLEAGDVVGAAWDALRGVYDPELCLDLVSLGLVYQVRDEGGALVVEMTLTTPGCPASEGLPEMARAAITEAVDGVVPVEVRVVWDPPWSPAMMDDDAAGALGFRRDVADPRSRGRRWPGRPSQWRRWRWCGSTRTPGDRGPSTACWSTGCGHGA